MHAVRCIARPSVSTAICAKNVTATTTLSHRLTATFPSLRIYSLRRKFAEKMSNKYVSHRATEIGPDLACLEWLMECGSTKVEMSDQQSICSIRQMKEYVRYAIENKTKIDYDKIQQGDLVYEKKWTNAPRIHIVKVDASDSAIANEGFQYFRDLRRLEVLKLNFCDYFGDEGLRELAMGRPAETLHDLEIVLNPCVTDGAVYWLTRLKALKRAHFYFLPYVSNRTAFIRQLKMALPRCNLTFPDVGKIGYGYEKKE